jgi:predicted RNA-binding Zn-ribbon protein involved in translation (DUF1610 family)
MGMFFQILIFVIIGAFFLWLGYSLFFGRFSPIRLGTHRSNNEIDKEKGKPGEPQVCLVCSRKLVKGEHVKSFVFPSGSSKISRLVYVNGCTNCLNNDLVRECPVCGIDLHVSDYLAARMFERRDVKNHLHVLGCNHCRKTAKPSEV